MDKKKRVQISFNVDPEFHKRIKVKAALGEVSMNLWLIRIIYRALREEGKPMDPPSEM